MTMPEQKPHRSEQDVETPREFIEAVIARFGPIEFDLAADGLNKQATYFFSKDNDALNQDWWEECPSGNLWLNPPFAKIAPWAKKCAEEAKYRRGFILMLTPASVGANWFARHVEGKAYVLALSPRLTFVGHTRSYPKDLCLSVYGHGFKGFDSWRWDVD